jgi:hypothetical protein
MEPHDAAGAASARSSSGAISDFRRFGDDASIVVREKRLEMQPQRVTLPTLRDGIVIQDEDYGRSRSG